VLRGDHIVLHSDNKEDGMLKEGYLILEWIYFVDVEVGLLMDGTSDYFESTCDDKSWYFGVFLAKIFNQGLEALEWGVKHCSTYMRTFSHVQ
jgi:hypothetical protein